MTRRRFLAGAGLIGTAGCLPSRRGAKTTLRYMAWGNPEQLKLEREIADAFEASHPGVGVHLFMVPGSSYADKLQLMLASRTAPDVMRADHYYFPALVRKDYFLCLDPFVKSEPSGFLSDFNPLALQECLHDGKLYALNVLFGAIQLYYNKAMLAEAGLPDLYETAKSGKWDWGNFVETAQALTKRDSGGRCERFGSDFPAFPQYLFVLWNRGGEILNPERTRFTLADDPQAVAGIQDMADLRWKHRCAPTPADAALSAFTFESGKIGMHWGWAGETPRFRKNISKFDWDIAPVPSGPRGSASVVKGNQLVISQHTEHPALAWEFLKFMTGPETERHLYGQLRRCVPTRLSVQRDPAYLKTDKPPFHIDVFLDAVARGRTLPIDARYQEWSQVFGSATDGLFNVGNVTASEACRTATDRINRLLSGEEGF